MGENTVTLSRPTRPTLKGLPLTLKLTIAVIKLLKFWETVRNNTSSYNLWCYQSERNVASAASSHMPFLSPRAVSSGGKPRQHSLSFFLYRFFSLPSLRFCDTNRGLYVTFNLVSHSQTYLHSIHLDKPSGQLLFSVLSCGLRAG